MAEKLGVSLRTYGHYERNERVPDISMLAVLMGEGWNGNWLIAGQGPERTDIAVEQAPGGASQPLRSDELKLSIQLAEEALDGGKLEPADYAELVSLIYDALVNGLPSAQIIAFARPAARGLSHRGNDGKAVGGKG
ncbi:helix-turn-helix domain-containing protein [Luteibacter aegosomatis]|uniref:helix-turn-helix domain-containing protein n=1 Tax=Luteibacter aegosomatis TaxID=2911537 RepID=UPI001FFB620D|nr:helix-turn-helix domain-containing protein [Luteibacter aegosomatis]